MSALQRTLNVLWVYALSLVLLAAYLYQLMNHEAPCPFCLMQRLAVIGIAMGALMNMRFGVRAEHYGLSILAAIFGRVMSARQLSLDVYSQLPTLGESVWGFSPYAWSLVICDSSILAAALLLILFGFTGHRETHHAWHRFEKGAFWCLALITFANVVTTLLLCGLSTC